MGLSPSTLFSAELAYMGEPLNHAQLDVALVVITLEIQEAVPGCENSIHHVGWESQPVNAP